MTACSTNTSMVSVKGARRLRIWKIRPLTGRNRYSHYPVIEMDLDLQDLHQAETAAFPGFVSNLLHTVPTLAEHHCSLGYPGGFARRLHEGTRLGHVVEHLALELQALAGMHVLYGRTRHLEGSLYRIVFEYDCLQVGETAALLAVNGIGVLLQGLAWNCAEAVAELERLAARFALGPSTRAILKEARKRSIPILSLGDGSLFQLGYGKSSRRFRATVSERTSCNAVEISMDKWQTNKLLRQICLPVPEGRLVEKENDLAGLLAEWRKVVVKPVDGNQGMGVTAGIQDEQQLVRAFRRARQYSRSILVERHIDGHHLRVLIVDGQPAAVAERFPPAITGDGRQKVRELIDQLNRNPRRGIGHERELTRIPVDAELLEILSCQGYSLEDIPVPGQAVLLGRSTNLSRGGTAVDITGTVHESILADCSRAALHVGLDIAGIDLITPRYDQILEEAGGCIIEVNAAPGIRMHLNSRYGRQNVAARIVESIRRGVSGSVPVIAVTGSNGKTTTCRLLARFFEAQGARVGLATTDGIWIGNRLLKKGDCSGPRSARAILLDRTVEAAVLETARGGILREGIGFDTCNVGVVLNIQDDHLGQDEVETLEELAWIKELVVESIVHPGGYAVLNADDPITSSMAKRAQVPVIYFSIRSPKDELCRHLEDGGGAVYFQGRSLVETRNRQTSEILSLKEIPLLWNGLARHQMQNVAAAVAAARAAGVSMPAIKNVLSRFGLRTEDNPGRMQLWRDRKGARVVLDYGHNLDGYRALLETVRPCCSGKLWGIVGVPGDRNDASIRRIGWVAASGFDGICIKEDRNLRGRKPGEVAGLLLSGAREHARRIPMEVVSDELQAVERWLGKLESGDWMIIFHEQRQPIEELLEERGFASIPPDGAADPGQQEMPLLRRM